MKTFLHRLNDSIRDLPITSRPPPHIAPLIPSILATYADWYAVFAERDLRAKDESAETTLEHRRAIADALILDLDKYSTRTQVHYTELSQLSVLMLSYVDHGDDGGPIDLIVTLNRTTRRIVSITQLFDGSSNIVAHDEFCGWPDYIINLTNPTPLA